MFKPRRVFYVLVRVGACRPQGQRLGRLRCGRFTRMAPSYSQKFAALEEAFSILSSIADHAVGGPAPSFQGLNHEAKPLVDSPEGVAVSAEMRVVLKDVFAQSVRWKRYESLHGKKRPLEVLDQQLVQASNLLMAYCARFNHMLSSQN